MPTIVRTSASLYASYDLKRIYYAAFSPIPDSSRLLPVKAAPLQREHRLYQADWLYRFYGFSAAEIAGSLDGGMLDLDIDPKLAWALRQPRPLSGRRERGLARAIAAHPGPRLTHRGPDHRDAPPSHAAARRSRAALGRDPPRAALHHRAGPPAYCRAHVRAIARGACATAAATVVIRMNRHFLDEKLTRAVLTREDAFEEFRDVARTLIGAGVAPRDVTWRVSTRRPDRRKAAAAGRRRVQRAGRLRAARRSCRVPPRSASASRCSTNCSGASRMASASCCRSRPTRWCIA